MKRKSYPKKLVVSESGKHESAEKPVSLKPLKLEEALEGLLKTKPSRKEDG